MLPRREERRWRKTEEMKGNNPLNSDRFFVDSSFFAFGRGKDFIENIIKKTCHNCLCAGFGVGVSLGLRPFILEAHSRINRMTEQLCLLDSSIALRNARHTLVSCS